MDKIFYSTPRLNNGGKKMVAYVWERTSLLILIETSFMISLKLEKN